MATRSTNRPTKIHLHRQSKRLELVIDAVSYSLTAEYLRVHSPSAEVRGHGPGQGTLPAGKINVAIEELNAMGNYGLRIDFDDGHNSGIYTWSYLVDLCRNRDKHWRTYLDKLRRQNKHRDPNTSVVQFIPPK